MAADLARVQQFLEEVLGTKRNPEEVCQLRGHDFYVHTVSFSPDGPRLASASGGVTVRIWDTVPPSVRAQRPDGSLSSRGRDPILSDGRPARPVGPPR